MRLIYVRLKSLRLVAIIRNISKLFVMAPPHKSPDCQDVLSKEVMKFHWTYNAKVVVAIFRGNCEDLAPQKFKTSVNIKERSKWSAFEMQTVAHKITFCLPWFDGKLLITRTRPIDDHLVKLGFGV